MTYMYPCDTEGVKLDFWSFSPTEVSYNTYKSYSLLPYFTYKYDEILFRSPLLSRFSKSRYESTAWARTDKRHQSPSPAIHGLLVRSESERAWVTAQCDKRGLQVATAPHLPKSGRYGPRDMWATSLADVMRDIKANSSRHIRQSGVRFAWQDGYAGISVSPSQVGVVKRYIANQKEHHHKREFEEELVMLLERAGVRFDRAEVLG